MWPILQLIYTFFGFFHFFGIYKITALIYSFCFLIRTLNEDSLDFLLFTYYFESQLNIYLLRARHGKNKK